MLCSYSDLDLVFPELFVEARVMIQGHWRYEKVMFNYSLITEIAQCLTSSKAHAYFYVIIYFLHICAKQLFKTTSFVFSNHNISAKKLLIEVVLLSLPLLLYYFLTSVCPASAPSPTQAGQVIKQQVWLQPHSTALHRFLEQGPICPEPAASEGKWPVLTRISHFNLDPLTYCQLIVPYVVSKFGINKVKFNLVISYQFIRCDS